QEGLLGALVGVADGAGPVVPDVDVEAVPHRLIVESVANTVSLGVEAADVEEEAGELDLMLVQAQRLELDLVILGEAVTQGGVDALRVVARRHVPYITRVVVIAESGIVGKAEAPVAVPTLESLQ